MTAVYTTTMVAAIFFLSGCTGIAIQDLRQEAPTRSATYQAEYEELGNCTAEAMQTAERDIWSVSTGNLNYEIINRRSKRQIMVTGKTDRGSIPLIDLIFTDHGSGKTHVESRQGGFGDMRRGGRVVEEQTWPMIERCVADQTKKS